MYIFRKFSKLCLCFYNTNYISIHLRVIVRTYIIKYSSICISDNIAWNRFSRYHNSISVVSESIRNHVKHNTIRKKRFSFLQNLFYFTFFQSIFFWNHKKVYEKLFSFYVISFSIKWRFLCSSSSYDMHLCFTVNFLKSFWVTYCKLMSSFSSSTFKYFSPWSCRTSFEKSCTLSLFLFLSFPNITSLFGM